MSTHSQANSNVQYLERQGKPRLAYVHVPASDEGKKYPLLMFCGGYRSDMTGTKATYLEQQCKQRGQAYVRFDYSGHGVSEGRFEDGTIGVWKQDALDVLNAISPSGPVVLAGSSMGGWIGLLIALEWKGTLNGFVGIAAAPDFTEEIYSRLNEAQKKELLGKGRLAVANDYSQEPYAFTKELYEDGKNHLILNKSRKIDFPVRLIQGMQDKDVPFQTALNIEKMFSEGDVDIAFVQDGDHRLSKPEDLALIDREICGLCKIIG